MILSDYDLVVALGRMLSGSGQSVSCAESCTGGGVAQAFTAVPGSSQWFGYGWVTYANAAKMTQLGVSESVLMADGAVSRSVAQQMAEGARRASGSDWALATTGIAGPGGGGVAKPVGTVWFAWAGPQGVEAECQVFSGSREQVRAQAVTAALAGLHQRLQQTTV